MYIETTRSIVCTIYKSILLIDKQNSYCKCTYKSRTVIINNNGKNLSSSNTLYEQSEWKREKAKDIMYTVKDQILDKGE